MNHKDIAPDLLQGLGIEIGAFTKPIEGIKPLYIDKFETFAGETCLLDYFGEAVSLPFHDNSLDYIANSHVFEHVANPVAALVEWYRVLKPGGVVYMVVPDKFYTFDAQRPLTPVVHMLEDFNKGVTDCDPTHIDDFVFGIDWSAVFPDTPPEEHDAQRKEHAAKYKEEIENNREINIHFHVFVPENFIELIEAVSEDKSIEAEFYVEKTIEQFPARHANGFLAILRKPKRANWGRLPTIIRKLIHRNFPLLKSARKGSASKGDSHRS